MTSGTPAKSDAYREGLKLSSQGRHLEAIEQFERALADQPDDAQVLFALGNTARALGLAQPAEEFYRRVLAQEPTRLEALVNLANLLRDAGPVRCGRGAAVARPGARPAGRRTLPHLGFDLREKRRLCTRGRHYRQALSAAPDYAAALGNLADLADR